MKVIVLMGLPGSGKSTIAKKWFPEYTYINQDTLGSKAKCFDAMHEALGKKQDVIIDRANVTPEQRWYWVTLALEYGAESITCIYIEVPEEECIARAYERKGHATMPESMPLEKKRQIVYSFARDLKLPQLSEGFTSIVITRN